MSVRYFFIPLLLVSAAAWENAQAGEVPLPGTTLPVSFARPVDSAQLAQPSYPVGPNVVLPSGHGLGSQYAVILWDESGRPVKSHVSVSVGPLPAQPLNANALNQALR